MTQASSEEATTLLKTFFLKNPATRFVRLQWVDYSGVMRTRIVTRKRCEEFAAGSDHYSLAGNCLRMAILFIPQYYGEDPQEWRLCPDWTTLKPCGFAAGHASVMCFVAQAEAPDPFARCPRHLLNNVLRQFQTEHQSNFLLGFEIEFVLLDDESNLVNSLDSIGAYSLTAGLRGRNLIMMEEIVSALETAGIPVYHFHVEIPDQLEIALAPLPPMQAIDAYMFAQEAIRAIGIHHEVRASLAPRPVLKGPQNGCHVHMSMNPPKSPTAFIEGIMHKMKSLCALGMPTYDSYFRVVEDGAGLWIGWGHQNRDLPVRRISDNRWELRFADCTANMYLLVAAVVRAGAAGMAQGAKPPRWKDCHKELGGLTEADLAAFGILERMPGSFAIALEAAKRDEDLKKWIGEEIFTQYVRLKEKEMEAMHTMTDETRRRRSLVFF
ncbi:protein fluG [Biscogniauxia sp. FL1348]|nr:protein fluG [Biscogniauxia sp. FL1348]